MASCYLHSNIVIDKTFDITFGHGSILYIYMTNGLTPQSTAQFDWVWSSDTQVLRLILKTEGECKKKSLYF